MDALRHNLRCVLIWICDRLSERFYGETFRDYEYRLQRKIERLCDENTNLKNDLVQSEASRLLLQEKWNEISKSIMDKPTTIEELERQCSED